MITQAITNLVKNAAEAAQAVTEAPSGANLEDTGDAQGRIDNSDAKPVFQGLVETRLTNDGTTATIEVIDNGVGLSKQMRSRLLEPYVTTKAKGTGLGLAIVQKIIEQHGGRLELTDAPLTETRNIRRTVRLQLPLRSVAATAEATYTKSNMATASS